MIKEHVTIDGRKVREGDMLQVLTKDGYEYIGRFIDVKETFIGGERLRLRITNDPDITLPTCTVKVKRIRTINRVSI